MNVFFVLKWNKTDFYRKFLIQANQVLVPGFYHWDCARSFNYHATFLFKIKNLNQSAST